ncbi:hypothetical protein EVAR_71801_1, partial [Eumeta japonica]
MLFRPNPPEYGRLLVEFLKLFEFYWRRAGLFILLNDRPGCAFLYLKK